MTHAHTNLVFTALLCHYTHPAIASLTPWSINAFSWGKLPSIPCPVLGRDNDIDTDDFFLLIIESTCVTEIRSKIS